MRDQEGKAITWQGDEPFDVRKWSYLPSLIASVLKKKERVLCQAVDNTVFTGGWVIFCVTGPLIAHEVVRMRERNISYLEPVSE
jgi:hypothetical protein